MLKGLIMALIFLAFAAISKAFQRKKKPDDGYWTCTKCSHKNPNEKDRCENCGEEKK